MATTAIKLRWICSLLNELGIDLTQPPIVYCDDVGATNLCANPVFHSRMNHVALDYHFIRDQVHNGLLQVAHVSSTNLLANALTKPLPRYQIQDWTLLTIVHLTGA